MGTGDTSWLCALGCIPPCASQGSVTEMLRLVLVEGDGECLCVKAPIGTLKPGGQGWDADRWGNHRQRTNWEHWGKPYSHSAQRTHSCTAPHNHPLVQASAGDGRVARRCQLMPHELPSSCRPTGRQAGAVPSPTARRCGSFA